jgi:hypothetical protein
MASASASDRDRRPQCDEVEDPWPLKALLGLALWPYFFILTVARYLPLSLGGTDKPTHFPTLRVLALCLPLTLLQAGPTLCCCITTTSIATSRALGNAASGCRIIRGRAFTMVSYVNLYLKRGFVAFHPVH